MIKQYAGKQCGMYPYTDEYKAIKSVPIVQADTEYENPETGQKTFIYQTS